MVIKWYLLTREQGVDVETMRKIYRVLSLSLIINPVIHNSTIAIVELEKETEIVDIRHSVRKLQSH